MARGVRGRAPARRRLRDDVGRPARAGVRPRRRRVPRPVALHAGPVRLDVPLEALDDADVRRLRHRRGHQPPLPGDPARAGGDGLSTAFDLPTLMGRDSDDPPGRRARWASAGSRSTRWPTWRTCSPGSTSARRHDVDDDQLAGGHDASPCTSPSPRRAGAERARLGGTLQNDILKEYQAQKEFVFPPRPSMRLVADVDPLLHRRDAPVAPRLDLRLPHPRGGLDGGPGAGLHPRQRLRLRGARHARPAWPSTTSRPASASSSTPTSTSSRRSPSTGPPGASGPGGCATATAPPTSGRCSCASTPRPPGVSLTAQQPEVNMARTAIEALAGVLGGTQSLHTNSMDEALALPTEKAARIALRTQQVIAHETGVAHVADPLGGSWFVEELTDEMERQAEEVFAHLDELGRRLDARGRVRGHRGRLVPGPDRRRRLRPRAKHPRPGAGSSSASTASPRADEDQLDILQITPEDEERQLKRLAEVRADRDARAVACRPRPPAGRSRRAGREPHAGPHRRRGHLRDRGRDHGRPRRCLRPVRRKNPFL